MIGFSQPTAKPTTRRALVGGRIVTMSGAGVVRNGVVLIDQNRIVAVGPKDEIEIPDDFVQTNVKGHVIMPGLIDTHVHVMLQDINIPQLLATPFSLHFYKAMHYMRRTLHAGITTVRDAGGADLGIKQAVEQGLIDGPRMQISITAMSITGGHGDGTMPSGVNLNFFPAHPGRPGNIAGAAFLFAVTAQFVYRGAIRIAPSSRTSSPLK